MRKTLLLIIGFFLMSTFIKAQEDSTFLSFQSFPIVYENSAQVLFQFQKDLITENSNFTFVIEDNPSAVIQDVGNDVFETTNYLISGLLPDNQYQLHIYRQMVNGSMVELVQSPFSIKTRSEGMIDVSNHLYGALAEWSNESEPSMPITDFFAMQEVSPYELVSFIQRYFYHDIPLTTLWQIGDGLTNLFSERPPNDTEDGDDCLCNFVINKTALAVPKVRANHCEYFPYIEKWDRTNPEKHWYRSSKIGAAHYAQLWEHGEFGEHRVNVGTLDAQDAGISPEYMELAWINLCLNYPTNLPEACECEKEIIVNWGYDARLTVESNDQSFFWDDGSFAVAQDYAIVTVSDQGGDFDVLNARRAIISTKCHSTFNPGFIRSIAVLVGAIGLVIENASAETIKLAIEALASVTEEDIVSTGNDCSTKDIRSALLAGNTTILLEPNNAKKVRLYSFYNLKVGGYGKWKPTARVLSNAYLSSVLLNSNDDDPPACCSDKHASYVIGHMPDAPKSRSDLRNIVGANIGLYGPWTNYPNLACCNPTVHCDWACIVEPNPNCQSGSANSNSIASRGIIENKFKNNINIVPNPTEGNLTVNFTLKNEEIGTIELHDINGKNLCRLYDGYFSQINRLDVNIPSQIMNGQYIITISSNSIYYSTKISLNRN